MFLSYVVVTILTIVANVFIAVADFSRAKFVLANSAEVRLAPSRLPLLGALKAAGAAGLVLGLLGARFIGIAAAAGLVLFFIGAITVHIRARVFHNVAFPCAYLALAFGSLALAVAR